MAKLKKPFTGVPNGEIYPVEFKAGDECPPELEAHAVALGALEMAWKTAGQPTEFTIQNDPFGYGERFARGLAEDTSQPRRRRKAKE